MTKEQEKAKVLVTELYSKISGIDLMLLGGNLIFNTQDKHVKTAIQCALIAVDLVISEYESLNNHTGWDWDAYLSHWDKVKEEIKKL